ncbi:MAG TPA: prenyltransferase, partial [Mycobacterium sp.]|nr:prenyltransferase [Mycobacterium sp.]
MTVFAGLVAALLAVGRPNLDWRWLILAIVGITLAHTANNLMNDLFDTQTGTDSASYPRALYAPHPVLSGLVSRRTLVVAIAMVNLADLAILVVLTWARGWPVAAFALAGFVLSVAYTAPPIRLKKRGLGEPDVLVVWGPLMVCGTYYSAVGAVGWGTVLASLPYGLLCTTVLMGKHIDKIPYDEPLGIHTLPVVLGERRARAATLAMMAGFYLLVAVAV